MTIKHFYFNPNPAPGLEIKGIPLTTYPTARTGVGATWACDVYDGFEDDYNNNVASLMILENSDGYYLSVYRSGVNADDLADSLEAARVLSNEPKTQTFYTSGDTTEFTVSHFNIKPSSYATIDGTELSREKTTISVADNKLTSTDTISANTEVIIHKN